MTGLPFPWNPEGYIKPELEHLFRPKRPKYLERRGEKGKSAIKSVSNYGDGKGRVWLLPAKP